MTFKDAVTAVPELKEAFQPGKQALKREHRALVACKAERRFQGSVDLDGTLASIPAHAKQPRWDYGIGYQAPDGKEMAVWLEVHPASTGEVECVLQKLKWLKAYLRNHASELWTLSQRADDSVPAFVWLATGGGVHITPNSPQIRRLSQAGLAMPRRKLDLP
jgi:hypothetical protein